MAMASRDPVRSTRAPNKHQRLLAEGFGADAAFYVRDGKPYAVYASCLYAEYWGPGDVREVRPAEAVSGGREIPETAFLALVRDIHGLN